MWIMTPFGILMPATLPTDLNLKEDWDLQVRSRERSALEYLRKRHMRHTSSPIQHTPTLDYEYRIYTRKIDFADIMGELIEAIDYEKFKPTTDRKGMGGTKLHNLYNEMWYSYYRAYSPKYTEPEPKKKKAHRQNWWDDAKGTQR